MKVILTEDVKNLGVMGSIVDVADGYGRNYLIPRSLAVEANPKNIKKFEHLKRQIQAKVEKARKAAEELAERLSKMKIEIEAQSGEEGKLFGAITAMDIAEAISRQGIEIDRRKILQEEPIKRLGTYNVPIKIHEGVTANITLEIKKTGS